MSSMYLFELYLRITAAMFILLSVSGAISMGLVRVIYKRNLNIIARQIMLSMYITLGVTAILITIMLYLFKYIN